MTLNRFLSDWLTSFHLGYLDFNCVLCLMAKYLARIGHVFVSTYLKGYFHNLLSWIHLPPMTLIRHNSHLASPKILLFYHSLSLNRLKTHNFLHVCIDHLFGLTVFSLSWFHTVLYPSVLRFKFASGSLNFNNNTLFNIYVYIYLKR